MIIDYLILIVIIELIRIIIIFFNKFRYSIDVVFKNRDNSIIVYFESI